MIRHGMKNTRIHNIWKGMKQRCLYDKHKAYPRYGGRGITICDEWVSDFVAFYKWAMDNGYDDSLTLDRIDNNSGYCPENCRWATYGEQRNNRKDCVRVTINGETRTITEWASVTGIKRQTIFSRYYSGKRGESLIKNARRAV